MSYDIDDANMAQAVPLCRRAMSTLPSKLHRDKYTQATMTDAVMCVLRAAAKREAHNLYGDACTAPWSSRIPDSPANQIFVHRCGKCYRAQHAAQLCWRCLRMWLVEGMPQLESPCRPKAIPANDMHPHVIQFDTGPGKTTVHDEDRKHPGWKVTKGTYRWDTGYNPWWDNAVRIVEDGSGGSP